MPDDITIPVPEPHDVTNVIEHPNEAIPHIVTHENRITHIEEAQARQAEDVLRQITGLRDELFTALDHSRDEQAAMLQEKITKLDELLARMETQAVEVPQNVIDELEQAPTEAIELVPEVEKQATRALPKGARARRKARHSG